MHQYSEMEEEARDMADFDRPRVTLTKLPVPRTFDELAERRPASFIRDGKARLSIYGHRRLDNMRRGLCRTTSSLWILSQREMDAAVVASHAEMIGAEMRAMA